MHSVNVMGSKVMMVGIIISETAVQVNLKNWNGQEHNFGTGVNI